jgi:hypothetical protein
MMEKKRKLKGLLSLVSVLVIVLTALIAPLRAGDVEHPLMQSFTYFPFNDNSSVARGKLAVNLDLSYSNVYMFNDGYTVLNDFENFSGTIAFRCGLTRTGTLEVYYRHTFIMGGILDKFIEDFHRFFKLPDNNRGDFPRNSVNYRFKDAYLYTGGENAASPLTVAYLKEFYRGEGITLKGRLAIGIPLSSKPGFSSGKPFITAGVVAEYRKKWFSAQWSGYLSYMKAPKWLQGEPMKSRVFFTQLELRAWRFIGGLVYRSSPFLQGDMAHGAYQGYLGYRISRRFEFIINEDFEPFDTTPDIGFHLRVKII